jgi:hypothetical protein
MTLLADTVRKEVPELNKNRVRLGTIGDMDGLPEKSRVALLDAINLTSHNDGLTLILALNYGGRDEIVRAVRKLAVQIERGELASGGITAETVEGVLDTAAFPIPICSSEPLANSGSPTSCSGSLPIPSSGSPMSCGRIIPNLIFSMRLNHTQTANGGSA